MDGCRSGYRTDLGADLAKACSKRDPYAITYRGSYTGLCRSAVISRFNPLLLKDFKCFTFYESCFAQQKSQERVDAGFLLAQSFS